MKECERVISSIEHFYGHLDIGCMGSLGLCSVENRADALSRVRLRLSAGQYDIITEMV